MEAIIEIFQKRPNPQVRKDIALYLGDKPKTNTEEIEVTSNESQNTLLHNQIIDLRNEEPRIDYQKFRSNIQTGVKLNKSNNEQDNTKINKESFQEIQNVVEDKTEKRKYVRRTKKIDLNKRPKTEVVNVSLDRSIKMKLPNKDDMIIMKRPSYYMNNRQIFTQFINQIFAKYRDDLNKLENNFTCDSIDENEEFKLLLHQKIVRDYLNIYTPYRGLLLYHGLGSGKTCSSIAIAEAFTGLSSVALGEGITKGQQVVVLVPASLRTNFYEELKKCGNPIFKKNQYWKFISIVQNNNVNVELKNQLSNALHLPVSFIEKYNGAFMVDTNQKNNYEQLNGEEKRLLDKQIDAMIDQKYMVINYNGLRKARLLEMTNNLKDNIFDNKVVIIDEAHNFISRIVNKVNKERANAKPTHISTQLYDLLMSATNTRIVMLTGTPIINYPNEIGICFNILRGYIKSWRLSYDQKENTKQVNYDLVSSIMKRFKSLDYLEVTNNEIIFSRNPYGFENEFYNDKYQ